VEARAVAHELACQFAKGAANRDAHRALPFQQVQQLSASGLLAITVPAEYGGADLQPSVVADVIREIASADPNIAQIPQSRFVYLNLLRLAGTADQKERHFSHVLAGGRIANAQSERGGKTVSEVSTTITRSGDHFVLSGTKYYCTGSLFAHELAVLARLVDPHGDAGISAGDYIAFIPADSPGVTIVDDWNGFGQRLTASGTIELNGVSVSLDRLVPRVGTVDAPVVYGAFAQLLHVAIDGGIARGALGEAVEFARGKSRPWFEAGVDRANDDPLLIQRFGELTVDVSAAEATLEVAAHAVDDAFSDSGSPAASRSTSRASLAVATAKILSDRAANQVSSALFEVSGTRSVDAALNLQRYWRNARTHTLHDPVRWKFQHIGRSLLHGTPPPTARSDLTGILFLDQFGLYFWPDCRHCQGVCLAQWVVVSTRPDEFVALTRLLGRPR
jgi:SfnB family sulfur acquisition oxidoreductase